MKKQHQLGMNPSTASGRLVKDILWKLIVQAEQDICYQCNTKMTRDNFSIEHKVPWLDSENPLALYFDLDNISFSHHKCNIGAARQVQEPSKCGTEGRYNKGCRCSPCRQAKATRMAKQYSTEKRRERYAKYGY